MRDNHYIHAGHMEALQPHRLNHYLQQARKKLRESKLDYDSIVFCGMSGAVFAPALTVLLGKQMIMVRKAKDYRPFTHSEFQVEGYRNVKRYIIVDDLVSTGDSVRRMAEKISEFSSQEAICVAVYCYLSNVFLERGDIRFPSLIQSSVAKIEEADDPTVAPEPVPLPLDWTLAQASSPFAATMTVESSDVPSEEESRNAKF